MRIRPVDVCMLAVCAMVGPGCSDPPRDPYRVEIDVAGDVRALGSDDLDESAAAADRLTALGAAAMPVLRTALARENATVRAGVVEVLQGLEGPRAAELLVVAAGDADAGVRSGALLALGLIGEPIGRDVVEAGLADADPTVRRAAAAACHQLCRSPAALTRLVALAIDDPQRAGAQRALFSILYKGDEESRGAARAAAMQQALPLLADDAVDDERRFAAAQVAAMIGQREALPVLVAGLAPGSRADRRIMAALALGGLDDPAAVAALAAAVGGADPGTRNAACVALGTQRQRRVEGAAEAAAPCAPPRE